MQMEPAVFEQVAVNSGSPQPASPAAPADLTWRGVLLAAPRVVRVPPGQRPRVPLCLYVFVPVLEMPGQDAPIAVVRNVATGERVDVPLRMVPRHRFAPPIDRGEPPGVQSVSGMAVGGHETYDLMEHVDLPLGEFDVQIELRGFASSTARVLLVEQP